MFDQKTRSLILNSPEVAGFDSESLPNILSEAYIRISTLRLNASKENKEELEKNIEQLRELANRLSIFASTISDGYESAAFVAATAFQLLASFEDSSEPQQLTTSQVPDSISAALLFFASGYPADATQIAAVIFTGSENHYWNTVASSIRNLCTGKLQLIVESQFPEINAQNLFYLAELKLLQKIHAAIRAFALNALGQESGISQEEILNLLDRVIKQSNANFIITDELIHNALSAFSSSSHISRLLRIALTRLQINLLTNVVAPTGVPYEEWRSFIRQRTKERPFLWPNHVEAIQDNLLNLGVSGIISFPTGAGKSTLSELKIAACALAGKRIIYIVPTLALAWQTEKNMRDLFSEEEVTILADFHEDQLFADLSTRLTGDINVMTPERCLMRLAIEPLTFSDIGLVVFDECHLLHKAEIVSDPRSLDAMLCLLNLLVSASEADFLLMSAMMSNGAELKGWLSEKFSKTTILADSPWKPTRQARGSLLFKAADIAQLQEKVRHDVQGGRSIRQRDLKANALALFSLTQVWKMPSDDFRVIPLLSEPLSMTGSRVTPQIKLDNTQAALQIACMAAQNNLKVIVFFPISPSVHKATRTLFEQTGERQDFNSDELSWIEASAYELGGQEYVFKPSKMGAGHTGDLLHYERQLAESCFRRNGGVQILFATSTLAQGINLPADLVIICRTTSGNSDGTVRKIEVSELLNAAGRAGRAGLSAYGTVLIIPDYILSINDEDQLAGHNGDRLVNDILGQDDRCLEVKDPCMLLLDQITAQEVINRTEVESMLLRMPRIGDDTVSGEDSLKIMLGKTLGAYHIEKLESERNLQRTIELAIHARANLFPEETELQFSAACRSTGLSAEMIKRLLGILATQQGLIDGSAMDWYDISCAWLNADPTVKERLGINGIGGNKAEKEAVKAWINGKTYLEINTILAPEKEPGMLQGVRVFVRKTIRSTSYVVGLIGQLASYSDIEDKDQIASSASIAASLLREGFDSVEKLILYQIKRTKLWTRVRTHFQASGYLVDFQLNAGESQAEGKLRLGQLIKQIES
jgi:hypothetical protein